MIKPTIYSAFHGNYVKTVSDVLPRVERHSLQVVLRSSMNI